MRHRRVLSTLVMIGLVASLMLPTSVSLAASPEPKSSDPKASGTGGVTVLAATASSTIFVAGGPRDSEPAVEPTRSTLQLADRERDLARVDDPRHPVKTHVGDTVLGLQAG